MAQQSDEELGEVVCIAMVTLLGRGRLQNVPLLCDGRCNFAASQCAIQPTGQQWRRKRVLVFWLFWSARRQRRRGNRRRGM